MPRQSALAHAAITPIAVPPALKPRALRLAAAVAYSGISRSELYRLAGAGRVRFIKSGATTLVVTETIDSHIDSLPAAPITTRT